MWGSLDDKGYPLLKWKTAVVTQYGHMILLCQNGLAVSDSFSFIIDGNPGIDTATAITSLTEVFDAGSGATPSLTLLCLIFRERYRIRPNTSPSGMQSPGASIQTDLQLIL